MLLEQVCQALLLFSYSNCQELSDLLLAASMRREMLMVLALMYHGRETDLNKNLTEQAKNSSNNEKKHGGKHPFKKIITSKKVTLDDCAGAIRQFLDSRLNDNHRVDSISFATSESPNLMVTVVDQEIIDAANLWGEGLGAWLQLHHPAVFKALFTGCDLSDIVHTAVSPLIPHETTLQIQTNICLQENKELIIVQREMSKLRDRWASCLSTQKFGFRAKKPPGLSIRPGRDAFLEAYTWTGKTHGISRSQWQREFSMRELRLDRQSRLLIRMRDIFKALMQIPDNDNCVVKLMQPISDLRDKHQQKAIDALKYHRVSADSCRISNIIQHHPQRVALDRVIKRIAENIEDVQLMYRIFSTANASKVHFKEFPVILDLSADTADTMQFPPMESDPLLGRIKIQDLQVIGQFLLDHRVKLAHLGADKLYVSMIEMATKEIVRAALRARLITHRLLKSS